MVTTFEQWLKKRGEIKKMAMLSAKKSTLHTRLPSWSTPPLKVPDTYVGEAYKGAMDALSEGRPFSEVGSAHTYRSVVTIEEHVHELEKKLDMVISAQKDALDREKNILAMLTVLIGKVSFSVKEVEEAKVSFKAKMEEKLSKNTPAA